MEHLQPTPRPLEVNHSTRSTLLTLDATRDASVLRDTREIEAPRMPLLMHPIVYVNNEVEHSQDLRAEMDALDFGDWRGMDPLGSPELSSRIGLGKDPTVWVHPAVVQSQGHGAFMRSVANGYLARTNLSADRLIQTQGLVMSGSDPLAVVNLLPDTKDQASEEKEAASDKRSDQVSDTKSNAAEQPKQPVKTTGRASLSFSSQLRQNASRLPLQAKR